MCALGLTPVHKKNNFRKYIKINIKKKGRRKNSERQRAPEFTSKRDERVKILANSSISEVDRIGVRVCRKSCAVSQREGRGMQLASSEE